MIVKPGRKTTEALATLALAVGMLAASLAGHLSPRWAAVATTVSVSAYSISRGLTKLGAYLGAAKATPGVVAPAAAQTVALPAPTGGVEG